MLAPTMIVPRSHAHTKTTSRKSDKRRPITEKMAPLADVKPLQSSPRPQAVDSPKHAKKSKKSGPSVTVKSITLEGHGSKPKSSSRTTPVHTQPSKPLPVPQAARHTRRSIGLQHTIISPDSSPKHLSPSVAALLAVTAIPRQRAESDGDVRRPPPASAERRTSLPQLSSTQQLMSYWREEDASSDSSFETGSNLDILLSPPQHDHDHDHLQEPLSRVASCESLGARSIERSPSSDSLSSLTADDGSVSSWSSPPTPPAYSRRSSRDKGSSKVEVSEHVTEHPLMADSIISEITLESEEIWIEYAHAQTQLAAKPSPATPVAAPAAPKPPSFKSNLTASFSALKASLRTLSNFTTTPHDGPADQLSQSLFGYVQYATSEMRPRPLEGTPTPELRRYLNPSPFHSSPLRDFHMHCSHIEHLDYDKLAVTVAGSLDLLQPGAVIALKERIPPAHRSSKSNRRSSADEVARAAAPSLQRREIRENSDFLRVCVLETNMRRAGKLDGAGRARFWLPPRQIGDFENAKVQNTGRPDRVPQRWVGQVP